MLEYLRNAAEKPVAKILIGILAFSFVGWGVAEWIFSNTSGGNTLMTVGGTEISAQQFNAEKSRALAELSRDDQRNIYTDEAAQNKFNQDVMATIATQQMVENRAHDLGFVVSDHRIAQEIREFPEFQINGEFSTLAFDTVLSRSGYSEADFANILRNQVLRSMVLGSMSIPVKVPEFAVSAAYNARYAERDIKYATVKYSDFKVSAPTDEQLQAFYAQNPKIVPETRGVSYILIAGDLSKPDIYDAKYETALKVEDDIIAGDTMADAAKKHDVKYVSIKPFDIANRPVDKIISDTILTKIFEMDEGAESEMIETKDGFVFIRIDKIIPSHAAEFDNVKKSLVADWTRAEQKKQAYVRANEILVDLNKNGTINGKSTTVSRASGAPATVLSATFHNPVGENTIVPDTDAFYVLHIAKETAPKADQKKMANLRKELESSSAQGIMDDYNSFLNREYPTEINEKVFNRLFAK